MPLQFCPFCGQAVVAGDAIFCANCGRAFPTTSTEAPGTAYGQTFASGGGPGSVAAAPVAVATAAPQVLIVRTLKSRGIAAVLEFFIPGTGAMYAGQVALGLLWLFVALGLQVGGPAIVIKTASSAYDSSSYPYDPSYDTSTGPQFSGRYLNSQRVNWLIVLGVLAVIWLIVRMVLATRLVDRVNRGMTSGVALNVTAGASPAASARTVTDDHVRSWVSGGIAVILFSGLILGNYFGFVPYIGRFVGGRSGHELAALPGLVFLLAVMRFMRTDARRATIEVSIATVIVLALGAVAGRYIAIGDVYYLAASGLAIGLAAGYVAGFGRPPIRGPQSEIRDFICLLIVVGLSVLQSRGPLAVGIRLAVVPVALIWVAVVVWHSRATSSDRFNADHAVESQG